MWGGPGFEVDFCLEAYIHTYSGSPRGFLLGSREKSVGSLPGRKSASGEPPAKHITGLFYPRSASVGFSGLSGSESWCSSPPRRSRVSTRAHKGCSASSGSASRHVCVCVYVCMYVCVCMHAVHPLTLCRGRFCNSHTQPELFS